MLIIITLLAGFVSHLQVAWIDPVIGRFAISVVLAVKDRAELKDHRFDPYQLVSERQVYHREIGLLRLIC